MNEKQIETIRERGIILLNSKYKQHEQITDDLYVTIIHEMLHSKRNLLLHDAVRKDAFGDDKNEKAYTFNNGKIEQNTDRIDLTNADAGQEILKGRIDTSQKTVSSYTEKTDKELENVDFKNGDKDEQLTRQQIVDEALVELMAILSNKIYNEKAQGNKVDIWKEIEKVKDKYPGEDIVAICKIILKHKDFELFNWMLDPISYSCGDIHYDFFADYTQNDQELVQELYQEGSECVRF